MILRIYHKANSFFSKVHCDFHIPVQGTPIGFLCENLPFHYVKRVFFQKTLQNKYAIWKAQKIISLSDLMMNRREKTSIN